MLLKKTLLARYERFKPVVGKHWAADQCCNKANFLPGRELLGIFCNTIDSHVLLHLPF